MEEAGEAAQDDEACWNHQVLDVHEDSLVGTCLITPYHALPSLDRVERPAARALLPALLPHLWDAGAAVGADAVESNLRYRDAVAGSVKLAGVWKHVGALLQDPLVVVATDPPGGAQVNHVGLSQLEVTFDRAVRAGPGLGGVTVTTAGETKSVFSAADGNVLRIFTTTPLAQPHAWTFAVTGAN